MYTRTILSAAASVLLISQAIAVPFTPKRQTPAYGQVISSCVQPGVVALTFDDGPFSYTEELLDMLKEADLKATFFVNGQNWDDINNHVSTIHRMIDEGHQIGSHTWDHGDLATMDSAAVVQEMTLLEDALVGILGYYPQYMRPPYFSYNDETLATLASLEYHVIDADIDTLDWQYNTPDTSGESFSIYENGLAAGGTISLMHDVHETTVSTLVPAVVNLLQQKGLKSVPVGECLGDDPSNWYRQEPRGH